MESQNKNNTKHCGQYNFIVICMSYRKVNDDYLNVVRNLEFWTAHNYRLWNPITCHITTDILS